MKNKGLYNLAELNINLANIMMNVFSPPQRKYFQRCNRRRINAFKKRGNTQSKST